MLILIFLLIFFYYEKFEKELNINCVNLNNTSTNFYTFDRNVNIKIIKINDKYRCFLEIIWLNTPNYRGSDIIGLIIENDAIIKTSINFELRFH